MVMRLYLDTNMVMGWFKRIMQNVRRGRPFKIPSVIEFLSSQLNIELIVSNITKIEIFRYLKSEWNCKDVMSEEYWNTFIRSFNITYIEVERIDFNELLPLCMEIPTKKKTLVNLIHLQVAKKDSFWFLSGEEELKERYRGYYDKILTYKELRQRLS